VILVSTAHDEYKKFDFKLFNIPVVDTRNLVKGHFPLLFKAQVIAIRPDSPCVTSDTFARPGAFLVCWQLDNFVIIGYLFHNNLGKGGTRIGQIAKG
jgi:hypothetical protein